MDFTGAQREEKLKGNERERFAAVDSNAWGR